MDEEKVLTPLEQLTEYCDCTDVEERDVNELISLISTYTCWAQKPCETFLLSERREVKDLPDCICDCDIFTFRPYFAPFEVDSFTFTLVEQNGINEIETPVTTYIYSEADEEFRMELPLPSCKCRPDPCGCKSKYKLVVTYVAGYENIPECLLPFFCESLQWIREKNKCDCEKCEGCEEQPLTKETMVDYTTITGQLQERIVAIMTRQYFNQLSLISLCRRVPDLWGVVV
jgi:hypothetical protein